jgi:glycolate oxidase FAD binding subunit
VTGAPPTGVAGFAATRVEAPAGLPPCGLVLAPADLEEAAQVLARASDLGSRVLVWGGGSHQGIGYRVEPDLALVTTGMHKVVAWEPEDLTLVVEAGARVADVEAMLGERHQTAALLEIPGEATVGGAVAAGASGYRRARFGPIRDRVLEVTLATGDGRVVRAGGRVVKNVTGYDLPRVVTGSLGRLGVIGSVCLKLWPHPEAEATVAVQDGGEAWRALHRPAAVLETEQGSWAFLAGTRPEVESQSARLGVDADEGHHWPPPPSGETTWSLRLPPAMLAAGISRLPTGAGYVAQHGVGEIAFATGGDRLGDLAELRSWAESAGGHLVLTGGADEIYRRFDPWGTPPPGLELQRRLVAAFDPAGVVNRGRLPGGL